MSNAGPAYQRIVSLFSLNSIRGKQCILLKYESSDCEYLLHTPEHRHFDYRNYYDSYWTPIMENIGFDHKPHDTRHTCISLLSEAHVGPTIIKKIVGHAGAMSLTERVYTELDIRVLVEAINSIKEKKSENFGAYLCPTCSLLSTPLRNAERLSTINQVNLQCETV